MWNAGQCASSQEVGNGHQTKLIVPCKIFAKCALAEIKVQVDATV